MEALDRQAGRQAPIRKRHTLGWVRCKVGAGIRLDPEKNSIQVPVCRAKICGRMLVLPGPSFCIFFLSWHPQWHLDFFRSASSSFLWGRAFFFIRAVSGTLVSTTKAPVGFLVVWCT